MHTPTPLSEAPHATPLEITGLDVARAARRLAALGLEPGVVVTITRRAPFGGPLLVALPSGRLALRADEAAQVLVVPR